MLRNTIYVQIQDFERHILHPMGLELVPMEETAYLYIELLHALTISDVHAYPCIICAYHDRP